MWNKPTPERLKAIPKLYANEENSGGLKEIKIFLHFFIGGCDWYIAEFDGRDTFFGYAILNGDYQNAEWGYISFKTLQSCSSSFVQMDCELAEYFPVQRACEIEKICHGMGWEKEPRKIESMGTGTVISEKPVKVASVRGTEDIVTPQKQTPDSDFARFSFLQ